MKFDNENCADTFCKEEKYLPLRTSLKEKKKKGRKIGETNGIQHFLRS
jgi:hypothetical protein